MLYIEKFLLFSRCGTKVPLFNLFSGDVEQCGSPDEDRDDRVALMRWTPGPSDHQSSTCAKEGVSDAIQAVRSSIITVQINSSK